MNYNDEKSYEEIMQENEKYLDLFEQDLIKAGLKASTIKRHLSNVNFYINEYLLYEEPLTMDYGMGRIDSFLGEFFIRKCIWSTPASIKSTAVSIKKFYKCMLEHGFAKKNSYEFLCSEIEDNMEFWQTNCAIYNDPDEPNPFVFF